MKLGDLFAKLAAGQQLSAAEIEQLRLGMNQQQQMASTVAGLVNTDGTLDLSFLPIRLIYSKSLVESTSSIKVPIPSDINNLIIFGSTRSDNNDTFDYNKLIVNDDTGANYEVQQLYGADAAVTAVQDRGVAYLAFGSSVGATGAANYAAYWFAVLPNIHSSLYKGAVIITGGRWDAGDNIVISASSWWASTEKIKSLTFTPGSGTNFVAASSFAIMGTI